MGRELRRVPMDFDHPTGEVWPGYLSPEARPCPAGTDCVNGSTRAAAWVERIAHLLLMVDDDLDSQERGQQLHPWLQAIDYHGVRPSPDIQELGAAFAGRDGSPFGHDAIDRWRAKRKIVEAAGLDPEVWGTCPGCDGAGHHPDDLFDDWEATDPPEGPGFQMWETTTEGSPQTPVFATLKELAEYCAEHCHTFGNQTASAEGWGQMLSDGMVTAVIGPGMIAI